MKRRTSSLLSSMAPFFSSSARPKAGCCRSSGWPRSSLTSTFSALVLPCLVKTCSALFLALWRAVARSSKLATLLCMVLQFSAVSTAYVCGSNGKRRPDCHLAWSYGLDRGSGQTYPSVPRCVEFRRPLPSPPGWYPSLPSSRQHIITVLAKQSKVSGIGRPWLWFTQAPAPLAMP